MKESEKMKEYRENLKEWMIVFNNSTTEEIDEMAKEMFVVEEEARKLEEINDFFVKETAILGKEISNNFITEMEKKFMKSLEKEFKL